MIGTTFFQIYMQHFYSVKDVCVCVKRFLTRLLLLSCCDEASLPSVKERTLEASAAF